MLQQNDQLLQFCAQGLFLCYSEKNENTAKEEIVMKKIISKKEKNSLIMCVAMLFATMISNSTCTFVVYQPDMPDSVKRLRKF